MYWAKLMAALLATRGMELENVVHVGSSTCPLKDIVREVAAHQRHRLLMIFCVETRSKRGAQANEPQRRTVWSRTRWRQSGNNHISLCLYFLLSTDIFLKPTWLLFFLVLDLEPGMSDKIGTGKNLVFVLELKSRTFESLRMRKMPLSL